MTQGVGLKIDWTPLQHQLAPADADGMVQYERFLEKFCIEHINRAVPVELKPSFSALYDQYPLLHVSHPELTDLPFSEYLLHLFLIYFLTAA